MEQTVVGIMFLLPDPCLTLFPEIFYFRFLHLTVESVGSVSFPLSRSPCHAFALKSRPIIRVYQQFLFRTTFCHGDLAKTSLAESFTKNDHQISSMKLVYFLG